MNLTWDAVAGAVRYSGTTSPPKVRGILSDGSAVVLTQLRCETS